MSSKLKILIFFLSFLVVSCKSDVQCEIDLVYVDKQIRTDLLNEFDKADVDYNVKDDGVICMSIESTHRIRSIMASVINRYIPPESSATLTNDVHKSVVKELTAMNIPYSLHKLGNDTYIVWDEKYTEKVKSIIESQTDKHLKNYFDESK